MLLITAACDDMSGPAPALQVEPDSFSFSFVHRRDTADSRQISIDNVGGGDLRWTAETEAGWLLVEPTTGTAPSTVAVRVDTAGLLVGSSTGVIYVTGDNGGVDSVIVTLAVEGAPPSGISFRPLKDPSTLGDTVFLIGPEGGNLRPFLVDPGLQGGGIAWAPDGVRFAYVKGPDRLHSSLYVGRADGSGHVLVVDPGADMGIVGADWSPDSRRIVYVRYDDTGHISRFDLWTVDVATGETEEFRRLGSGPAWSPDGEWIAFNGSLGSQSGIVLRRVDGAEEILLVHDVGAVNPSWSPDGEKIIYSFRDSAEGNLNDWDLHIVEIATGERTILAGSPDWDDTAPVWSPDGLRVLFSRSPGRSGITTHHLFTIAPDGSNLIEVPHTEGALSGQWRPWVAPEAGRR